MITKTTQQALGYHHAKLATRIQTPDDVVCHNMGSSKQYGLGLVVIPLVVNLAEGSVRENKIGNLLLVCMSSWAGCVGLIISEWIGHFL